MSFGKWNTSWKVDLLLPIWLGCLCCCWYVQSSGFSSFSFFFSSFHYFCCCKKYFNEFSTPFLTLFRKWSIIKKTAVMPTLSTVELFSSASVYVGFFLLCCVLEISFEAYMLSRRQDNAQVCLTFSQISFIQLLTAFLQPPTSAKHQIQFNLNSKNDRF